MQKTIDVAVQDLYQALPFTPAKAEVDRFAADLLVVSHPLMKAAVREFIAGRSPKLQPGAAWREEVLRIYNRKVAENAQMFPLFHSFECAFRATTAAILESHYKIQRWWAPVLTFATSSAGPTAMRIGVVDADLTTVLRIKSMLQDVITRTAEFASLKTGYDVLDHADISHVQQMIKVHWNQMSPMFVRNGQQLSIADFDAKFSRVRIARNIVYHHRSLANKPLVYETTSDLLAYLGFDMSKVHRRIRNAQPLAPPYWSTDADLSDGGGV